MSFLERIHAAAERVKTLGDQLETEEATKNALVMPFIAALGYDVFNPGEVVPEFTADVGTKKGEKVDYAIKHGGEIVMLVECKRFGSNLREVQASQLYRYFSVTNARIALLTNGQQYQFFSDLEEPNKMDARPFLELDMNDLREPLLRDLEKLSKESFDLAAMLGAAGDLKALRGSKVVIEELFAQEDEEFAKLVFRRALPESRWTQANQEWFTPLVLRAIRTSLQERVNTRLRQALQTTEAAANEDKEALDSEIQERAEQNADGIVTTEDELEGFRIVRAIVCSEISPDRVAYRDAKSYFAILVDDNNRQPICRLRFNSSQKYVGTFDEEKNETRHPIDDLEDIYNVSGLLREGATRYR